MQSQSVDSSKSGLAANSEVDLDCSPDQAHLWLRGLLSLAWVDGNYDPQEKALINELIRSEWPEEADKQLDPITPAEFAAAFDPTHAEDFLRTAVMTAIADGVYSEPEDRLLQEFCQALKVEVPQLHLLKQMLVTSADGNRATATPATASSGLTPPESDALQPIRDWMDGISIQNRKVAHFLCKLIPNQCPFERDVVLFNRKVMHIPAMCKLNPLYEQVVGLRFRALSFLADDCGEDVTKYVQ